MAALDPCPCGNTPSKLIVDQSDYSQWAWATPDCCREWSIEFRAGYEKDPELVASRAAAAWNAAPRQELPDPGEFIAVFPPPRPPSLREKALHALGSPTKVGESRVIEHRDHELIRLALQNQEPT